MSSQKPRAFKTIIEDRALFQAAKDIRKYLADISGLYPRLNESVNPYYGNTVDGLTIIEYYDGPSSVGTPLGQWTCTGGGSVKARWRREARERLGLVLLSDGIQNCNGYYGNLQTKQLTSLLGDYHEFDLHESRQVKTEEENESADCR